MNLHNLKWTKSVNHKGDDEHWAYKSFKAGDLFKLAWKNDKANADKPQKEDLILLRQQGYVTHLVRLLDYKSERESWQGDFNIYRIVEVLWAIDWNHPPTFAKADKVFDYPEVLNYEGGNAMYLETLPTFKQHWNNKGGLSNFQTHVQHHLTPSNA